MPGKYANFWKASHCSICYLGIYVALFSAQNIQSVMFEDDGLGKLGYYSNAFAYLGQIFGGIFSIIIAEKMGVRSSIFFGSALCVPFIVALLQPAYLSKDPDSTNVLLTTGFIYATIIIASILNGVGQGISQSSAGSYISDCANEATKGFYFSYFWAFFMGSQVFGNLIAAYVLGLLD